MEGAGKPRHRSQNPRGEGERAREAIESKPSEFEAIATVSAQHPAIRVKHPRFHVVATFVILTSYFVLSRLRATAGFFDRTLAASGERQ